MALQNSDLFLVGRGSTPHKITYDNLKTKLVADGLGPDGSGISDAPADGKQYGRQNNNWTEITSSGGGGGGGSSSSAGFLETPQTLESNQDIDASVNAICIGPVTVDTGITLTIGANSKLSVLYF